MLRIIPTLFLCYCLASCVALNLDSVDPDPVMNFHQPIKLLPKATGEYTWKISTENDTAQAYFNQGMQLRYGFNINEAIRSMAEARRLDPNCAMCYWGEAFALGSFLNGGMSKEKAPYAHAAITRARELAATQASGMERDLINATVHRYPADYETANRRPVDQLFADEMSKIYAKYPGHHDVATIYAVALFMLEQRRGYRDIADPDLIRLHRVLTGVLDENIAHPGACHLYIHATESSQRPDWALDCAEHLADAIPGASHIQHMPSHTWNKVGMWGKSVRTNMRATHADKKAKIGEGVSYGASHNLHMLLFAASYDGQGAVATQAGKDYAKLTNNTLYQVLTLIRFGRFDEITDITDRPDTDISGGMWDFAQGYASLRNNDQKSAQQYLNKVVAIAENSEEKFRFHPADLLLGTLANILKGEISRSNGNLQSAVTAFELAVNLEDQLNYDEPESLPFSARHWLGAALLESKRYADAERIYREELLDHPHNGWSLFGLKQALRAQNRDEPPVDEDFAESWDRSDVWITASRF